MRGLKWLWIKIYTSLYLDAETLGLPFLSLAQKLDLILKKYWLLIKYYVGIRFRFGSSNVRLWGRKVYFEQGEGIVRLQSIVARHMQALLSECTLPIHHVVDVGANVGHFSRAIKLLLPDADIVAVEPIPDLMKVCRSNLADLQGIRYMQTAVGDHKAKIKMKIDTNFLAECRVADDGDLDVEMDTLDGLIDLPEVDLMKVDVEGFESVVLRGAQKTLARTKYLLLETSRDAEVGFCALMAQLPDFRLKGIILYRSPDSPYRVTVADLLLENSILS